MISGLREVSRMSNKREAKIKITLKSDICMGSGYSYAGIVDSDVCYDEEGIPYIPAKRLKGCLRETYEGIVSNKYSIASNEIFGKRGAAQSGDFYISNAYLDNYNELKGLIKDRKSKDKPWYDSQNILNRYTHILGQTKIDKGVAVDNSLRYTRVVNRYLPGSKEQDMVFFADITYSKDYEDAIQDCIKGTRHIGMKRNRGFGNVKCELDNRKDVKELELNKKIGGGDEKRCIAYQISNITPLMLSGVDENKSEDYIAGQNILGALATRFLEKYDADSKEFQDLFLNNTVQYTNAYPLSKEGVHYPAPMYINQLKKNKRVVNSIVFDSDKENDGSEYSTRDGNIPKKMNGKYIRIVNDKVSVLEVDKDIVYHNSHTNKNDAGEEGLLYGMEVVREGQQFEGRIFCPEKYVGFISQLLKSGDYYFGKSKSSQYGRCRILGVRTDNSIENDKRIDAHGGEKIVVTFQSDAIFVSDDCYTINRDEVVKTIAKEIGIGDCYEIRDTKSYITTTKSTGYMGVWNLRKNVMPTIAAGSAIVYKIKQDCVVQGEFVGERNIDGYGNIKIQKLENLKDRYGEAKTLDCRTSISGNYNVSLLQPIMTDIIISDWLDEKLNVKMNSDITSGLDNTQIGRVTLMLKESINEGKNDKTIDEEFENRIKTIKKDSTKSKAKKLYDNAKEACEAGLESKHAKELEALGYKQNEIKKMMKECWSEYLMQILVYEKYISK